FQARKSTRPTAVIVGGGGADVCDLVKEAIPKRERRPSRELRRKGAEAVNEASPRTQRSREKGPVDENLLSLDSKKRRCNLS
ncbi:hypothetical protein BHM03_00033363, partial [Ensete ventricosum]